MRAFLWFACLVLAPRATPAQDKSGCAAVALDSLRDLPECEPHIALHGISATIVMLRVDTSDFPNPHTADDGDEEQCMRDSSGHHVYSRTCHCEATVQYVRLEGREAGLATINAIERRDANGYTCSPDMASVARRVIAVSTSPDRVSIVTHTLMYCQGCGGSCHGNFELATYDARSGARVVVRDVVRADDLDALPDTLAGLFVARYGSDVDTRRRVRHAFATPDVGQAGVYVESDKTWVNVDDFVFGCAPGNFFPVPIPAHE